MQKGSVMTEPPIQTAHDLLKELRDTTPITAQRKRIDAFLAILSAMGVVQRDLVEAEVEPHRNLAISLLTLPAAWAHYVDMATAMGEPLSTSAEATGAKVTQSPSPANTSDIPVVSQLSPSKPCWRYCEACGVHAPVRHSQQREILAVDEIYIFPDDAPQLYYTVEPVGAVKYVRAKTKPVSGSVSLTQQE